jgi:hypothetical protein
MSGPSCVPAIGDCAKHRQPGPVTVHTLRLLDLTHERNAKKLTAENDAVQLNAL